MAVYFGDVLNSLAVREVGRGGAWAWGERVWSLDVLTFDQEERNGGSGWY